MTNWTTAGEHNYTVTVAQPTPNPQHKDNTLLYFGIGVALVAIYMMYRRRG